MEHKRRQYPQQQYSFEAQQQASVPVPPVVDPAAGGIYQPYAAPPMPVTPGTGAPLAGVAPGDDPLAAQVGGLSMGGIATAGPGHLALNQLYSEDLLQQLPPPVNDLDLPPPPLQVPAHAAVTQSPYAQASPDFFRSTLNVIPRSSALLRKSKLPFACVIRPTPALLSADEAVPVVNDTVIARCRRCRTYINPFVEFVNQGARWKCTMCNLTNEVPSAFDYNVFESRAMNRMERPELNYGVVDFIAPKEYLTRPPQPPVYVFVIDASVNSTAAGVLQTASRVIKESLDNLPNLDGRTRVAFIAVDGALNYFQIPLPQVVPGAESDAQADGEDDVEEPRMLVVSDLDKPFLPSPTGLLVNLKECRRQIDMLLDQLPQIFSTTVATSNALGSALQASLNMIANIGGKIVCVTASLPNIGLASLEPRDERKLAGSSKEKTLFQPAAGFYKSFAVDCNRHQVSVDMFLLSSSYQDVASLSSLPKYTGGSTYFYPGWSAKRETDVAKFEAELGRHLSKEVSMEAMLRVRSCSGLRSSGFSGHFFVRQSDLMTFPMYPRDHGYVVEMTIDDNITRPYVLLQSALLHTTCFGERRIRVITAAIPTSSDLADIYASVDQQALTAYYAHHGAERALHNGLNDASEWLVARLLDIVKVFKTDVLNTHAGSSGALLLSSNLKLLPLLVLALKKTVGLRRTTQILSDIRVNALNLLQTLPLPHLIKYLYPDLYALHDLPDEAGLPDPESGEVVLPERLNLTGQSFVGHGMYLIDDGQVIFLWVQRDVVPQLLLDAFGVSTLEEVPAGKTELPVVPDSNLNERIRNLIDATRSRTDSVYYPSLYIVKDSADPALRLWASTLLVEDRSESDPTYHQFLNDIREKLTS